MGATLCAAAEGVGEDTGGDIHAAVFQEPSVELHAEDAEDDDGDAE